MRRELLRLEEQNARLQRRMQEMQNVILSPLSGVDVVDLKEPAVAVKVTCSCIRINEKMGSY